MYSNLTSGGYAYILASAMAAGVLYIGVTTDLIKRVYQHREGITKGFTWKYKVHRLVHFEEFGSIEEAIQREKKLKFWKRAWKIQLIEKTNPKRDDLYPTLIR